MRGTVAKRLKRMAEEMSVGFPNKEYNVTHVKSKLQSSGKTLPDGTPEIVQVDSFLLRLEKRSTRWAYKQLKAQYSKHHYPQSIAEFITMSRIED